MKNSGKHPKTLPIESNKQRLEELRQETGELEISLQEFISKQNITLLRNFAFEWSQGEIDKYNIKPKSRDALHIVRRFLVYKEAIIDLQAYNLSHKRINSELHYCLPDKRTLYGLINNTLQDVNGKII